MAGWKGLPGARRYGAQQHQEEPVAAVTGDVIRRVPPKRVLGIAVPGTGGFEVVQAPAQRSPGEPGAVPAAPDPRAARRSASAARARAMIAQDAGPEADDGFGIHM